MHRFLWSSILLAACEEPAKVVTEPLTEDVEVLADSDADGYLSDEDCDDEDATVNPGIAETCDGIDNNCDGETDEGVTDSFYLDSDGDGYGDPDQVIDACEAPEGHVPSGTDCDDAEPAAYPMFSVLPRPRGVRCRVVALAEVVADARWRLGGQGGRPALEPSGSA